MSAKTSEISFSRWRGLVAAGIIIIAALGAYHNSFSGPFILDDNRSIVENQTIRQLFSIKQVLLPPVGAVQRRPIVNLSLALNYRLGGLEVTGYHVFNLITHILVALTLFGVVRRTLRQPVIPEVLRGPSTGLALVIALIWTVHPLGSNAVTYIIQRTELLVALFYLLTLYCVIRGNSSRRSVFWYVVAVMTCLVGMGSKEVMISAPFMIFLYDRLFLSRSFKEVIRQRGLLYLGLVATCGLVIAFLPHGKGSTFGLPDYAPKQFAAITTYLKLCFWPAPLILDYGMGKTPSFWQALPYAIFVIALLIATLVGVRYKPRLGFLGIWFFCLLAPSSSFVGLNEWAAEKRMYLPLAAVVVAVVLGGYIVLARRAKLGRVLGYILAGAVVVVFGLLTFDRNYDYASEFSIWDATVIACPDNHRAYNNRGMAHRNNGNYDLAIQDFDQAIALRPAYAQAYNSRGFVYSYRANYDLAISDLNKAIELEPGYAEAYNNRGISYGRKGELDRAIGDFNMAIKLNSRDARAYSNRGLAYLAKGDYKRAIRDFDQAIAINPASAPAYNNLAWILATHKDSKVRDGARAVQLAEKACELTGYKDPTNLDTLAAAYAQLGQFDKAVETAKKAMQIARAAKNEKLAKDIQKNLELYEAKRPYPK